jgi:hypothetical protein
MILLYSMIPQNGSTVMSATVKRHSTILEKAMSTEGPLSRVCEIFVGKGQGEICTRIG